MNSYTSENGRQLQQSGVYKKAWQNVMIVKNSYQVSLELFVQPNLMTNFSKQFDPNRQLQFDARWNTDDTHYSK